MDFMHDRLEGGRTFRLFNVIDGHASVSLFEEADDLLIGKSALFHGMSPFSIGEISCRIFILLYG